MMAKTAKAEEQPHLGRKRKDRLGCGLAAARVVVAEAAVRVAPASRSDRAALIPVGAELRAVISDQEVPVALLGFGGFGHVGQKTPVLAPVVCSKSELGLPRRASK
ncbi:hypothetical protein ZWY2020_030302 [Hordeum vulgare]|nr:hypothetical protein ZWY2020_030302 [Hordeum vulgare]